ncbi:unnamed protein product [Trifolium pratense]|uniref:Uncharacterized protein n=1 Tax=Trifolium pratense TaxID=57577 RepID=A0ACB0IWW6_TRIPR|nr:unnamed protein product [Trifolium pratense]
MGESLLKDRPDLNTPFDVLGACIQQYELHYKAGYIASTLRTTSNRARRLAEEGDDRKPAIQVTNKYEILSGKGRIDYKHCKIITIVILQKRDVGFGGFLTGVVMRNLPNKTLMKQSKVWEVQ